MFVLMFAEELLKRLPTGLGGVLQRMRKEAVERKKAGREWQPGRDKSGRRGRGGMDSMVRKGGGAEQAGRDHAGAEGARGEQERERRGQERPGNRDEGGMCGKCGKRQRGRRYSTRGDGRRGIQHPLESADEGQGPSEWRAPAGACSTRASQRRARGQ